MASPQVTGKKRSRTAASAAAANKYKLYAYWRSSASWRVRIVLHLKNLDYDYIPVHLVKGEQMLPPFTKLNPMQQLPVLVTPNEGKHLSQSLAIMEYLEEAHPHTGTAILPKDAYGRASVRKLAEIVNSGIQPLQNLKVLKRVAAAQGDEAKMQWGKDMIQAGLAAYEQEVKQCAGLYSYGDAVTMADACLVPQLYNARRFKVPLEQFPTIVAIDARLAALPAFQKAHADAQPDAIKS